MERRGNYCLLSEKDIKRIYRIITRGKQNEKEKKYVVYFQKKI